MSFNKFLVSCDNLIFLYNHPFFIIEIGSAQQIGIVTSILPPEKNPFHSISFLVGQHTNCHMSNQAVLLFNALFILSCIQKF